MALEFPSTRLVDNIYPFTQDYSDESIVSIGLYERDNARLRLLLQSLYYARLGCLLRNQPFLSPVAAGKRPNIKFFNVDPIDSNKDSGQRCKIWQKIMNDEGLQVQLDSQALSLCEERRNITCLLYSVSWDGSQLRSLNFERPVILELSRMALLKVETFL